VTEHQPQKTEVPADLPSLEPLLCLCGVGTL
jgi:hypothetical protein